MKETVKTALLRDEAEERLVNDKSGDDEQLNNSNADELIHELRVHKIELEMQNEELNQSHQDLYESKQELQKTHDNFYDLFNNAPAGYVVIDPQGFIVQVNQTFANMTAIGLQNIENKPLVSFMQSEDQKIFRARLKALIKNPEQKQIELRMARFPDGFYYARLEAQRAHSEFSLGKTQSSSSNILIVIHDIDDAKKLELELRKAKLIAEQASLAKSEFLSSMSHELRTPLNGILGFSQLLELDDNLSREQIESVAQIHSSGKHLLTLINDILDLSAIDVGELSISLGPVNLSNVVQSCVALLSPLAEKRNITLTYSNLDGVSVLADSVRLKQVLINLLTNAIKYNHEGGKVLLSARVLGSKVLISVLDKGYGIEKDKLDGLFVPFNRLGRENGEIEGTGIGLSLTHKLVELMKGRIGVDSTPGKGSCFWVEFPLAAANGTVDSTLKEIALSENSNFDHMRTVLYIEDNPSNTKLMESFFNVFESVRLLTAHRPSLGLELANAERPDVILLDINLPEMDGYQVMKQLQQNTDLHDIPVIAITANAMPEEVERGNKSGFYNYLTKPLDLKHLKEVLKEVL